MNTRGRQRRGGSPLPAPASSLAAWTRPLVPEATPSERSGETSLAREEAGSHETETEEEASPEAGAGHDFARVSLFAGPAVSTAPPVPPPPPDKNGSSSYVLQRDEAGGTNATPPLPPVPDVQLTPPPALRPDDPSRRYGLGGDWHLRLDPEVIAFAQQYVWAQLDPTRMRGALGAVSLAGGPTQATPATGGSPVPGGAAPASSGTTTAPPPAGTPSAPAAASTPPRANSSATGPGAAPRTGTAGDMLRAALAIPEVDAAVTRLQNEARDRVARDWRGLNTGERVVVVTTGVLVGGGILAGVISDPDARQFALGQLNGKTLPIPYVPGTRLEVNTQGDGLMIGIHVDVGRMLPASWGFGPGSPGAIGGPPQPLPSPIQRSPLRRKMAVSQPGDPAEIEAERVADQVMRTDDAPAGDPGAAQPITPITPAVSREAPAEDGVAASSDVTSVVASGTRGGGQPLDSGARTFMEDRFGHDFSHVRVHTDAHAASSARDVQAHAYAVGSDVVFGDNQYAPGTSAGRKLLAHELTHVAQQAGLGGDAVQRWTMPFVTAKSNKQLIEDGCNGDVGAIKEISDFGGADEKQKLTMIGVLTNQGVVGPRDERALESLWNGFGDRFMAVASGNIELWKKSVGRDSDLKNLGPVKKYKEQFPKDVQAVAAKYMQKNRDVIKKEMERLGIPQDDKAPLAPATPEQADQTEKLQKTLVEVANAQSVRRSISGVYVGYNHVYDPTLSHDKDPMGGGERKIDKPAPFDPDREPDKPPKGDDPHPMKPYAEVNKSYTELSKIISDRANADPAVYAVLSSGMGDPEATAKAAQASPEEARRLIGETMRAVLVKIQETEGKLGGSLDPLDLFPIHEQLLGGQKPPPITTAWNEEFAKWTAGEALKDHKNTQFWIDLGLGTLAAAAFVVAEIATAGTATFFIAAGVGLAVTGAEVAGKWSQYMALADAAKTNVSDDTALVKNEQVNQAEVEAILASALAILAAVGVGAKIIKGLRLAKWGVDPAMRAADEAAGIIVNGKYIKNPTAIVLDGSLATPAGKIKIGGNLANGQYMYVVDESGTLIIGTRSGQRMPHPTLIGGANPQVRAAGIVEMRGGRIFSVDNASGHFKPPANSLPAAEAAFRTLPERSFHPDFKGFKPFDAQ